MNTKRNITITVPKTDASTTPTNLEKVHEMRKILHRSSSQNDDSNDNTNTINTSWDQLWKNELTPWDIGKPTPVLISELKRIRESYQRQLKHRDVRIKIDDDGKDESEMTKSKFYSLIPGCGGGYDLLTVAKHHELQRNILGGSRNNVSDTNSSSIVIGLDISPTSLIKARDRVQRLVDEEIECMDIVSDPSKTSNNNSESNNHNDSINTSINFMHGDFFAPESTWSNETSIMYPRTGLDGIKEKNTSQVESEAEDDDDGIKIKNPPWSFEMIEKFDFIFDYTFFCALPPSLRAQWGERMSTLLQPHSGKLLTLIFPIPLEEDDGAMEGPPFPVKLDDYKKVLEPYGFQMIKDSPYEHEDTVKPRRGRELVSWWKLVPNAKSSSKL